MPLTEQTAQLEGNKRPYSRRQEVQICDLGEKRIMDVAKGREP